ncbi:hypothetical protein HDU82_008644 [Entophlyctis luteolus]|nr:hypothetical protein HDU82_008644 [Entophlyctis luteolus]
MLVVSNVPLRILSSAIFSRRINQSRALGYFRAELRSNAPQKTDRRPSKDPMAGLSDAEVKEIKRDINFQSKRAYSIGYAIIGGGMGAVLALVWIKNVNSAKTKAQYALKYMNKNEIIKRKCAEQILSERRLLEEVQHPFIVNMRYAFQDDEHLLMVLDLKLGGDLRFHLNFKGPFSETRARFYYAEVASALCYLHKQKIVHRDIKPDNILLDEKGHASVTDFNVACHFSDDKPLMSKSGTARYMAPEVILGHGYFNAIDFWSLSVTTYELLYGYTPFRSRQREDLKKSITTDPVEFSQNQKHNVSAIAVAFLKESLEKPLTDRLGTNETGGFEKITKHSWFLDLDWSKVESKEIPVPFIPDTEKNTYYDPRYGLEEMFSGRSELSDRPVKTNGMVGTRKRTSVRSPSSTSSVGAVESGSTNRQSVDKSPRVNVGVDRSNAVHPSMGSTTNSPTKDSVKTEKLRKASLMVSKQEPEYISSEEELQLQMFEEKFAVFDWTKPRAAHQHISDINTEERSAQESCTSHVVTLPDMKQDVLL